MRDAYCVDTSVFVRRFIKQPGWEHARELRATFLGDGCRLVTTDSVRFELAHVLRTKGLVPQLFDQAGYVAAVRSVDDLGVEVRTTNADALERAAALAAQRSLRFFDALLVNLALNENVTLLTTDGRLCRAVDDLLPTELLRGSQGV